MRKTNDLPNTGARQAIDRELSGDPARPVYSEAPSPALDEFVQLARQPRSVGGEPFRWKRADLYAERENRWRHQIAEERP
jgi:hypothetical protein